MVWINTTRSDRKCGRQRIATDAKSYKHASIFTLSRQRTPNTTTGQSSPHKSDGDKNGNGVDESQRPTINWECHTDATSKRTISALYGKPVSYKGVHGYDRLTTVTVTTTVTTTVATTELKRPGEAGHSESIERLRAQDKEAPSEKNKRHKRYHQSRLFMNGDREHHQLHDRHRCQPQPVSAIPHNNAG